MTFAIIKPDAVRARVAGQIIQRIEAEGFQIRAMRLVSLNKREAEGFYAVHRERPFFSSLTTFMSSGPAIVLALEAPDAIKKWRALMGATGPASGVAYTARAGAPTLARTDTLLSLPHATHTVSSSAHQEAVTRAERFCISGRSTWASDALLSMAR